MSVATFTHCGEPRLGAVLKGQPSVTRRDAGHDHHTEFDIRWGCYKLTLPDPVAAWLYEQLGAARGNNASTILQTPSLPGPPAGGEVSPAPLYPCGAGHQTPGLETGHDIGAPMWAEMFEQHTKRPTAQ